MPLDGSLAATVSDGAVEFTFSVSNADTEPVALQFHSGQVADVAVFDDGTEVWRWSSGRAFTQAIHTETMAPGESFVHECAWEGPPPGEYTASAELATANLALTAETDFVV